jgi:hypothetical protein
MRLVMKNLQVRNRDINRSRISGILSEQKWNPQEQSGSLVPRMLLEKAQGATRRICPKNLIPTKKV